MKNTILSLALGIAFLGMCLWAFGAFNSEASAQQYRRQFRWSERHNRQLNQDDPNQNLWVASYGGEKIEDFLVIVPASDGTIIMGGITQSINSISSLRSPWIQKIDPISGAHLWQVTLEIPNVLSIYFANIYPTDDGGCWVIGNSPQGSWYAPFVFRLSSNGELVGLPRAYFYPTVAKGQSLDFTPEGDFLVAGIYWLDPKGSSYHGRFIAKHSPEDIVSWSKVYKGPGDKLNAEESAALYHSTLLH